MDTESLGIASNGNGAHDPPTGPGGSGRQAGYVGDVGGLQALLESLLFAAGAPVPLPRLVEALDGPGRAEVQRALLELELDGRLGHDWTEDRWADFERDVAAAVDGAITLRLGWRQVLDPCRVAASLVRVLRQLGWTGTPRACSPGCPVGS